VPHVRGGMFVFDTGYWQVKRGGKLHFLTSPTLPHGKSGLVRHPRYGLRRSRLRQALGVNLKRKMNHNRSAAEMAGLTVLNLSGK
jgi:hypothetical protein